MSATAQIRSHRDLIVRQKAMDLVEDLYFLANARGSLLELDTHLEIAVRLKYLSREHYSQLRDQLNEVAKILNGLMRAVEQSSNI